MKRSYEELPYGRFAYVDQTGKKLIVVCVLLRVLLAIIVTLNLKPGKL